MSNSHSFPIHSWSDVYQRLRAKAEASRGMVGFYASTTPGATFPHTTSRDAFAIALVFDAAVNNHASRALVARWIGESDLLAGEPEGSTETYVGNRSFWETLAIAAIELDHVHAPLPALSLIDDAMRELETARPGAQQVHHTAETMLVTVLTESSFQAMAVRQFEFFRMLRGPAVGENPSMPIVPATCNADVLALADYWTDQLARVGANASDTYCRLVYSCWRDVLHRALRHAKHAPALDTYVHNTEFWNALLLLTTQSDVRDASPTPWAFQVPRCGHQHAHHRNAPAGHHRNAPAADTGPEAPTRWTLVKETAKHAIAEFPNTLKTAVNDLASDMLAKPLLYVGVGLGGLALTLLLRRSNKSETRA